MSVTKEVTIQLNTIISNGQDTEVYELVTFGTLQHKKDTIYLRYDEVQQDMQNVHTILKWSPDEVFIMRSGPIKMRQRFKKDLMTTGTYESPYGTMQMLTLTKKMDQTWNELDKEGKMVLVYDLNMHGNDVGKYEMQITYKEEANK
ncbi:MULTISPECIES: DUF1934 domain-containing protein [Bacillus]|uniref:DUF1934 domain-containing protein n=1 Tax=Bacillus TaxID=1386 RepID=UPI0002D5E7DE|nr:MULTISPECIES: DUF1934 domain-containing protein [Bacillus]